MMEEVTAFTLSQRLAGLAKRSLPLAAEFESLVRGIGESKSKSEEDAIVLRMVDLCKQKIREGLPQKEAIGRPLKELLVYLVYIDMLGHDTSWARAAVIQLCSNKSLVVKKVAYLATSLIVDPSDELNIMVTATIQADLKSDNFLVVSTALQAICRCAGPELISVFLPQVVALLRHDRDHVKKKALLALQRFVQLDAGTAPDVERHLVEKLGYKEPSVMVAALCGLHDLVRADPAPYRNLIPYFTNILKQAAEGKLGRGWDYHRAPAPFVQLQLLRLLALLGAGSAAASGDMTAVLVDVWRRADALTGTVGNAIMVECIRTATTIHPSEQLLAMAMRSVGRFLAARDNNQRYAGIDALARLVAGDPARAAEHQIAVVECLRSPDATLKRRTLDLLFKMAGPGNVDVVAREVLAYLLEGGDEEGPRRLAAQQMCDVAERLAPDQRWYIDTVTELFEVAGDVAPWSAADTLARVVAEGSRGEDPAGDAELRRWTAARYVGLLDRPKLPPALLRAVCWVLGEYGLATGRSFESLTDRVAGVAETQAATVEVRAAVVAALGKLAVQAGRPLPADAAAFLDTASRSEAAELQQAAAELQALLRAPPETQRAALPYDASATEVAVDMALPFLDDFVRQAATDGAAPYLDLDDRIAMGVTAGPDRLLQQVHHQGPLKFAAYQLGTPPTASPPAPPAVQQPASTAPVFDDLDLMGLSITGSPAMPPAAAAPPPPPAAPAEPQLLISKPGRKWGPSSATPPAPSPPAAGQGTAQPGSAPSGSSRPSATPSAAAPRPVDAATQQLAASLFGGGGGGDGRAGSGIRRAGTRAPAAAVAPELDLLGEALPAAAASGASGLDSLLGPGMGAQPQAQHQAAPAMDALSALAVPPSMPPPGALAGFDLLAPMLAPPPRATPPAVPKPNQDPFANLLG